MFQKNHPCLRQSNFGKLLLLLLIFSLISCASIKKSAMRSVSDMLTSSDGGSAFTSDDDPRLIAESLPLALKLHEILLEQDPQNAALAAATGRNYIMYSGAFVQMPADRLEDDYWEEAEFGRKRAKKLYLRGRNYLFNSLELSHKGFRDALESKIPDTALAMLTEEDALTAYWAGLGWLGMASADPLDLDVLASLDKAVMLLYRSLELDSANAGLHDAMIQINTKQLEAVLAAMRTNSPATAAFMDSYYANAGVANDSKYRIMHHYKKALSADGTNPSPHVTMARAVAIKEQDPGSFRRYLNLALDINPDDNPENRLMIILYQEQAQWLPGQY